MRRRSGTGAARDPPAGTGRRRAPGGRAGSRSPRPGLVGERVVSVGQAARPGVRGLPTVPPAAAARRRRPRQPDDGAARLGPRGSGLTASRQPPAGRTGRTAPGAAAARPQLASRSSAGSSSTGSRERCGVSPAGRPTVRRRAANSPSDDGEHHQDHGPPAAQGGELRDQRLHGREPGPLDPADACARSRSAPATAARAPPKRRPPTASGPGGAGRRGPRAGSPPAPVPAGSPTARGGRCTAPAA